MRGQAGDGGEVVSAFLSVLGFGVFCLDLNSAKKLFWFPSSLVLCNTVVCLHQVCRGDAELQRADF